MMSPSIEAPKQRQDKSSAVLDSGCRVIIHGHWSRVVRALALALAFATVLIDERGCVAYLYALFVIEG